MGLENKIRDQIEAILVNDAKNYSEIIKMASGDEPLEAEVLDSERNLYQRIINGYRNAVNEVNKLLEQNINSLSAFYRIVETIKEKDDFQEICSRIIDCILQDFGAEYCSFIFPADEDSLCLEGIREDRKFIRIHSKTGFLGGKEFEIELTLRAKEEATECLNIQDIYKEPRFNSVDFPAVIRSVLCMPISLNNAEVGFLILSNSLPNYFHENHVRVLKILGSLTAHLKFLHAGKASRQQPAAPPIASDGIDETSDPYSIAIINFDAQDSYGRRVSLDKKQVRELKIRIRKTLENKASVLCYEGSDLLVIMPGVTSEVLPDRVKEFRDAFASWKMDKPHERSKLRINIGCSSCEGEEDLSKTLEIAAAVMHPEDES